MITYQFNKESGIVLTTIKGETNIQDFYDYILAIHKNKNIPKVLRILTDATQGHFSQNVKPEDMLKIVSINKKYLLCKFEHMYDAIILTKSFETALGYIYKNEYSEKDNFSFKIFSTKKAAEEWLNQF